MKINLKEVYQPQIDTLEMLQRQNPTGLRQDEIRRMTRIISPNIYPKTK